MPTINVGNLSNLKPFFFDLVSYEHLDKIPDGHNMSGPVNDKISLHMAKKNGQIEIWIDFVGTDFGAWPIKFPFVKSFNKEAMFNAWKLMYFKYLQLDMPDFVGHEVDYTLS